MKAWQRQIREQEALRSHDGLFDEAPPDVALRDAVVRQTDFTTAQKIIAKYEWLGTMPTFCTHYYAIYFGGWCGGVVVFGISLPQSVLNSICGEEYGDKVRVLSRGACLPWTPSGAASTLISRSLADLKLQGYRIVVAYSDVRAGEIGTIYQACNALYTGESIGGDEYFIEGKWRTGKGASHYAHKKRELAAYPSRERSLKHRYVWLLGSASERRKARKALRYSVLPYPKRNADEVSEKIRIVTNGEGVVKSHVSAPFSTEQ